MFDELTIEKNYNMLHSMMRGCNCNFSIAYSIKTNPLRYILSILNRFDAWAEATSQKELHLAKDAGFSKTLFNGIYKSTDEIEYAVKIGAIIILDGPNQFKKIQEFAATCNGHINAGIRLSSYPIMNDNGIRFGIPASDSKLMHLIHELASHNNIDLCCLHMHLGTNVKDPKLYSRSLEILSRFQFKIKSLGINIRLFDLGGGMPSCPDNNWRNTFQSGISSFHEIISDPEKTLIIEPGRSIVENAGFLITKVVDIRKRCDGSGKDVIVDAGTNCIMGEGGYQIIHDCYEIKPNSSGDTFKYRILGPLCSSDDIILNSFEGMEMQLGNILLFSGIGAYDFSTAYQFSRDLPQVYVLKKDGQLVDVQYKPNDTLD
jgi:diaminopimelate decarboxylase